MKRFTILLILLSLGCWSSAQEIDAKQVKFVNKFVKAVFNHKQSKVIKLMDKEYSSAQINFLGGNKEQFVDELLSGVDRASAKFINSELKNIDSIEVIEAKELATGEWEYVFLVEAGPYKMDVSLLLTKAGSKYGFIGASG